MKEEMIDFTCSGMTVENATDLLNVFLQEYCTEHSFTETSLKEHLFVISSGEGFSVNKKDDNNPIFKLSKKDTAFEGTIYASEESYPITTKFLHRFTSAESIIY